MTHIYFQTPVPVYLTRTTFDVTSVPRVGDEICLKAVDHSYKTFKVEKVTWYEAREPYEGLEAEIELSLCDE
jgi:hypothetical protein